MDVLRGIFSSFFTPVISEVVHQCQPSSLVENNIQRSVHAHGEVGRSELGFDLASTAKRADVINTPSSHQHDIVSPTPKTLGKPPSASDSGGVPIAAVQYPLLAFVPRRLRASRFDTAAHARETSSVDLHRYGSWLRGSVLTGWDYAYCSDFLLYGRDSQRTKSRSLEFEKRYKTAN